MTTPQNQTAVQRKPAASIRTLLEGEAFRQQVAKSLPTHLKPDRFIRVALTTIMRTPKLAQCDQSSFFNSLLTLSQLGIEPDGRRAHLIPFENRKRGVVECQLIVDYKGLAELAMRSGVVSNLHADVVCENDVFDYNCGEITAHRIDFRRPRGAVYAAYAICRFKDGSTKCDVMDKESIEAIRARSKAGNNGPWVSDWAEMAKKTVFRRLSKWLPLSPEFRDAIEAEDEESLPVAVGNTTATTLVATIGELAQPEDDVPMDDAPKEGGFVPVGEDSPPVAREVKGAKPAKVTPQPPQAELCELVTNAGFTFDEFRALAGREGLLQDADSLSRWSEVKTVDAKRLLVGRKALLEGLRFAKGGGE